MKRLTDCSRDGLSGSVARGAIARLPAGFAGSGIIFERSVFKQLSMACLFATVSATAGCGASAPTEASEVKKVSAATTASNGFMIVSDRDGTLAINAFEGANVTEREVPLEVDAPGVIGARR